MGDSLIIQVIGQLWRILEYLAGPRVLAVQHAQRAALQTFLRVPIQCVKVYFQIIHQRIAIARPVRTVTQGVQLQRDLVGQAQGFPQTCREQNDFSINIRAGHAEGFHPNLVELAIPACLGPLVTEHGPGVPQPLGLVVQQPMLLAGTHTAGRAFRAQGQAVTVTVVEGVHFLFDDIGHFTDAALEQIGLLHDGHADFLVAVAGQHGPHFCFQPLPQPRLFRQDIVHPADGGDFLAHENSLKNAERWTPNAGR